jgi:hypothetical protein
LIYLWFTFAALAGTMIFAGIRYRPALWRWLAVLELFSLLWLFGNCFVPGSWKQFWEFGIPLALLSGAAAISSSILRTHDKRISSTRPWPVLPQMLTLYVVLCIIGVMILTH